MRVRAFAKINLSLRVLGTRPDGYHELRTTFQSLALHDTLTIRRARGPLQFSCDDLSCPVGDDNLVVRAAARMWRAAGNRGAPRGVRIHLVKRIPIQGGLGGGSSDCAAAIRSLGRLWRVDKKTQNAIGHELGADVPYFFDGGTALGVDRGDRITPLPDIKSFWVVLVLPSFGVSTKQAFEWFDASRGVGPSDPANDLEAAVARHHPPIARYVRALRRSGAAQAAMTGSGSTVFGLFSSRQSAEDAAAALFGRGRRVLITRTIDRKTYRRLAAK